MSSFPLVQDRMKSRSIGLKLIVVCGLALLMTIPALFVGSLIDERTSRANDVAKEIASFVGGKQNFLDRRWRYHMSFLRRSKAQVSDEVFTWSFRRRRRLC